MCMATRCVSCWRSSRRPPMNADTEARSSDLPSATRPLRPELVKLLRALKPGQKIRVRQTVKINCRRSWTTQDIVGTFRGVNFLATGIATDRVPEDDIVVVTVHFTKE